VEEDHGAQRQGIQAKGPLVICTGTFSEGGQAGDLGVWMRGGFGMSPEGGETSRENVCVCFSCLAWGASDGSQGHVSECKAQDRGLKALG